jgi:drug/metabolite transporter (DMT)-like permease
VSTNTEKPAVAARKRDTRHRTAPATMMPVLFVLAWSSGAVATPFGLAEVSPQAFLAVRATGCALIAWTIWGVVRDALPTSRRAWARMAGVGLLMQVAYQGAFFIALDRGISPGLLALIVSAQPLLTAAAVGARSIRTWVALALGVAGVALAVGADLHAGFNTAAGVIAAVGALAAITAGTMAQSRSSSSAGLWAALAIQSALSAIVFALLLSILGVGRWEPGIAFVGSAAWMILVVSIGATALLYLMVRSRSEIGVTSLFFTVPGVTAIFDYLINETALTVPALIGFALTISALVIITRAPQRGT